MRKTRFNSEHLATMAFFTTAAGFVALDAFDIQIIYEIHRSVKNQGFYRPEPGRSMIPEPTSPAGLVTLTERFTLRLRRRWDSELPIPGRHKVVARRELAYNRQIWSDLRDSNSYPLVGSQVCCR